MTNQLWVGSTDVHFMLTEIGGWHVGCYNAIEASMAIEWAQQHGYVGRRTHYAPAWPSGTAAYELTDDGLDYIRRVYGEESFQAADKTRQWYRDRVKQWKRENA